MERDQRHEMDQQHYSSVLIVDFERISQLFLVFLLLILNDQMPAGVERNEITKDNWKET